MNTGYFDPMTQINPAALGYVGELGAFYDEDSLGELGKKKKSLFGKIGKLFGGLAEGIAPLAANYFAPGSGALVSKAISGSGKRRGGGVGNPAFSYGGTDGGGAPAPAGPAPAAAGSGLNSPVVLIALGVGALVLLKGK